VLKLDNVHVAYGVIEALKGISLEVHESEIVAIIGANGAGKSTTLMTISGLLRPTTGSVYFDGQRIDGLKPHRLVARGIAQIPEGRRIFPRLTVVENLEMGAFVRQDPRGIRDDLDKVFDLFPILKERQDQKGGTLSGGEQQMLAIGRALMSRPRFLLLDEPSLGLAPLFVSRVFLSLKDLNAGGVTMLLVEQNARMALRVASRAYVMETGRIVMHGPAAELAADPAIKHAYLGGNA
jgi:branched-chain amino acid transport system ATP-binding protein